MVTELRETHFPYCLRRLTDGRYIVLNRDYKPLGQITREWVNYDTHPSAVSLKLTPAMARRIAFDGSENTDNVYLYNDACVPTRSTEHMKAYLPRLAALMALSFTHQ